MTDVQSTVVASDANADMIGVEDDMASSTRSPSPVQLSGTKRARLLASPPHYTSTPDASSTRLTAAEHDVLSQLDDDLHVAPNAKRRAFRWH